MLAKEHAVWLLFGFYLLNMLIPIIPAVIIYWLFPQGKASNTVEGSVGVWKIKAIGAWGAYVTAFVLGFWAISSPAVSLIKGVSGKSVWEIDEVNFHLMDEHGQEIDNATVDGLLVESGAVEYTSGTEATITVISDTMDPPEWLHVKLDGYKGGNVHLKGAAAKDFKILLSSPITLTQRPLIASASPPKALPAGTGPAALASNQ
jgi:hypothetical protein